MKPPEIDTVPAQLSLPERYQIGPCCKDIRPSQLLAHMQKCHPNLGVEAPPFHERKIGPTTNEVLEMTLNTIGALTVVWLIGRAIYLVCSHLQWVH